ncbi:MAG: HAMP domain-containing sensor histidine kinase [Armatimonadota bacterium]
MRPAFQWRSLRTQLIFWNVLALSILLGGLGMIIRYTVIATMIGSVDRELDARTRGGGPRPGPRPGPPPERPREGGGDNRGGPDLFNGPLNGPQDGRPRFGQNGDGLPGGQRPWGRRPFGRDDNNPSRPHHFDRNGLSTEPSDQTKLLDRGAFTAALREGRVVYVTVSMEGEPFRVLYKPVPAQPPYDGAVQALYPMTEINRAILGLNRALLILVPVALLCAGAGGAALTDQVLRRVRQLAQSAANIGASNFSERLPVLGRDEFSSLAETFNGMLGRLETAFQQQKRLVEQQRRFTADASHELKTPLTIIKGNTSLALAGDNDEAGYRQSLQEIDVAANTMSQLVQDLLLLARSDGGQLGRGRIDLPLREILEQALAGTARDAAGPRVKICATEGLRLTGNETELIRLFRNLLDNALRHTPSEGNIIVEAAQRGPQITVTVTDTGAGIAPIHLPHLGERFYRIDDARSRPTGGTGLGLSICRGIVDAHGGTITFESKVGAGTSVRVTLPTGESPPVA